MFSPAASYHRPVADGLAALPVLTAAPDRRRDGAKRVDVAKPVSLPEMAPFRHASVTITEYASMTVHLARIQRKCVSEDQVGIY